MMIGKWPVMCPAGRVGLMLALLAGPAMAAPLLLAPGDRVAVSVLGRADLGGSLTLRSDGTISMHVIGALPAAGLSEAGLEAMLETALAEQTQLPASVTVFVEEWRPVYVSGRVMAPGAFGFRPGMTVGQAVALAGGLETGSVTGASTLAMRVVEQGSRIAEIELLLRELAVQHARLQTEAATAASPDAPAAAGPDQTAMTVEQRRVFDSHRLMARNRDAAAAAVKLLAGNEADSLASQRELLGQQIAGQEASLADLQALFDRGLANVERLADARRGLTSDRIELMTAASFEARARQEIANADAAVADFTAGRQRDIAAELAAVGRQQRAARQELASARRFVAEFGPAVGYLGGDLAPPRFRVTRSEESGPVVLDLDATDPLHPGDLVEAIPGPQVLPAPDQPAPDQPVSDKPAD